MCKTLVNRERLHQETLTGLFVLDVSGLYLLLAVFRCAPMQVKCLALYSVCKWHYFVYNSCMTLHGFVNIFLQRSQTGPFMQMCVCLSGKKRPIGVMAVW